ncbi:MAG: hypothetical protein J07HQW1_00892 [Haloquadratum walsbyi J07HQW1]|uniref:Uncharacterized protein n=1 Tax=Haloquadratum walsbyi J07HQW1 TaxID=1238424 RepID=U1MMC0_9EURY|nr:MAG: hypothetical protein J07HQW1_00892 [Haloquadratum walsbyi J07HQW1]
MCDAAYRREVGKMIINIDHPIVVAIQCLLFESKSKRAHTGVPAELSVNVCVGSERNSAQSATDC